MNKISKSRAWELDRDHLLHPYTDFSKFRDEGSQVISRAEGMYVSDDTGADFLDGIAGLWCVNIGHGRREMAEAILALCSGKCEHCRTFTWLCFGNSSRYTAKFLYAVALALPTSHLLREWRRPLSLSDSAAVRTAI